MSKETRDITLKLNFIKVLSSYLCHKEATAYARLVKPRREARR